MNVIFKNKETTIAIDEENVLILHCTKDAEGEKISRISCSIHELIGKLIKNVLKDE